jgi:hypothetical protein
MDELFAGGLPSYLLSLGDDAASRMCPQAQAEWAIARASMSESVASLTANDATTSATSNDKMTPTVAPNVKPVARDAFVTAWRDNGHISVAALARELGVEIRTAQRWVKAA